jgi:hypothetical protein
MPERISKRYWLTFEGERVNTPCLWRMSRAYPEVSFDIRQASVKTDIGIMAVLLEGPAADVDAAAENLRSQGVIVEPVGKNAVEG